MEGKMFITRNQTLKKMLKNVVFLILLLKMCSIFSQAIVNKNVIVIDPGHGGKDSGAIGINGIKEKHIALNIAKEILHLNKTLLDNKFDIYLTRYGDTLISLSGRSRLAKSLNVDVFVSLHCNASKTISKGMEVYVHTLDTLNSKESIALGLSVLNESAQKLGFNKRGIKFANLQVLRETINFCPAILIESGFITNPDEAGYFLKPKNIRAMALAILMGMYNYLNMRL